MTTTKTMMHRYLPSKLRVGAGVAVLMCLLLAAALSLEGSPAGAQSGSGYVDLVVTNHYGSGSDSTDVRFVVHNYGTAEAKGVTVSFLIDELQARWGGNNAPPPSSVTDVEKADGQESFTWVVGTIPAGGSSRTLSFGTVRNSTGTPFHFTDSPYLIGSIRAEASSQTFEPSGLKTNNVRKVYQINGSQGLSRHMVDGRLALSLSVDNLRPTSSSPDVDFGLTARSFAPGRGPGLGYSGAIADIEISVELSAGLKFKDGWTPPAGFTKSGSRSATWNPDNVDRSTEIPFDSDNRKIDVETALTGGSLQAIPLSERCITVEVTDSKPPPEPGYALSSLKQCLGDDPPVLFETGDVAFHAPFPCLGIVTFPCRDENNDGTSDNNIEIAAWVEVSDSTLRDHGVGRLDGTDATTANKVILRPESVFIQVKDPQGRTIDNHANSVNTGTAPSWRTVGDYTPSVYEAPDADGVQLQRTRRDFNATINDWESINRTITVSDEDGNAAPGRVKLRSNTTGSVFYDPNPSYTRSPFAMNASTGFFDIIAEFAELGTYKIDYTAAVTHNNGTPSDTMDDVVYSGTGSYIIHVGPIAELEVRDAGQNMVVPAGQRAFIIAAVNNGPDDAPAARVRVDGLTEDDVLSHSVTAGSFDPASGVWSIGELREKYALQQAEGRDSEVLTIFVNDDASAGITAEIENTQNYSVCINSSGNDVSAADRTACTGSNTWHTTKYYDYISDNDSATINATGGTGTGLPSLVTEPITAIRVAWNPVDEVNGLPVTHYEVQRRTNPWETVAKVQDPSYFDLDVQPGETREYRVRAVNDREQSGPWSGSAEGTVPEPEVAPVAVVKPPATEPIRILRIEPSISEVSLKGGSYVRLNVEVYGRQDLRDDALGDRSDVTFDWALEEIGMQPGGTVGRLVGPEGSNSDRNRTSTLDGRRVLYIAPDSPGRYRIVVSLDPGTECLDQQFFETEEEAEARCTAVFEVNALRSSQIETATLNPRNPEGVIPVVLADSEGFQYEVFTPVGGGAYVHESASVIAGAGAVPDYEMIGLRISESGAASNEGVTYGRYRLGGDWYDITAVDASGRRVEESYELNGVLDVCVPLPAELSSNISELAMVSMDMEDSLTIHSSRVRISMSGMKVCGHLSTVPTRVAVGTAGAPRPVPTAFPEVPPEDAGAGFPDAGGLAPPSVSVTVWMGVMGLSVVVLVVMVWRRRFFEL